jgi:hypothetical protein
VTQRGIPVVRLGARVLRVPRAQLAATFGLDGELDGLPAMLTVEEAARAMRISLRLAYQLANEFLANEDE